MDPEVVRRLVITALFSDDFLLEQLVLKGGNALNLVHKIGSRSSLDIDLSIQDDFSDLNLARDRLFRVLGERLAAAGLVVFDEAFQIRPASSKHIENDTWGGYEMTFKITEREKYDASDHARARMQREALVVGPKQERVFSVHISRFEYCAEKQEAVLDDFALYVYTPAMIAFEKLRAICQQMSDYSSRGYPTPRARDFYDIHAIVQERNVDFGSRRSQELIKRIFEAKNVPLSLLRKIGEYREFHRQDWPQVKMSVAGELKEFDFYFDFVLGQVELLKPFWEK